MRAAPGDERALERGGRAPSARARATRQRAQRRARLPVDDDAPHQPCGEGHFLLLPIVIFLISNEVNLLKHLFYFS